MRNCLYLGCTEAATHEDLVPYEGTETDDPGVAWTLCCTAHASPAAELIVDNTYKLHDLTYEEILQRLRRS